MSIIETPDLFADLAPPGDEPPAPPAPPAPPDEGDSLPLGDYAERCYLAYAMSVVTDRALPAVEDGQKPVQRRILYVMNEMGMVPNSKPVKSARVVGEVMGKYHPHGDSSIYEAAVLMAQDFSLRYPLIDGQGNFGSRDGDKAAAMRYTEARLTPIADLLLAELHRGTVDFQPNYDGGFQEPVRLPARLPMVLLNGSTGIAVGMATKIPSHNLREVARAAQHVIDAPDCSVRDLLAYMPGPDLPGGGQLISPAESIAQCYESGRGSLRVRARWTVEPLARGHWRIVITEFPPGVSAASVSADIEELINPQPKTNKKGAELTADQKQSKALMQSLLESMRDESDEKHPVRLVFEPKSSRQNPDEFMAVLLAQTGLESSLSLNLVMLGSDGRPRQKNLKDIVSEWVGFRFVTVTRRTQHRLSEVQRRIHILEGRMIAFLHIDEVIRVIRESDEPKPALIARFDLSDMQAEDILEIRLRQLARLEGFKIERELGELREEQSGLQHLLADRAAMTRLIRDEIGKDADKYGDARRTKIEEAANVVSVDAAEMLDEPVTVILSRNGWARTRQGHAVDRASISYKAGDGEMAVLETRTSQPLILIDSGGRAYTVKVSDLPGGRGDGAPLTSVIELASGCRIVAALAAPAETRYLFASSGGYGFTTPLGELVSRQKAGKAFMTLADGETVLAPAKMQSDTVACLASNGRLLLFAADEIRSMAKGRGLLLIALDKGEKLVAVTTVSSYPIRVAGQMRGGKSTVVEVGARESDACFQSRARKGKEIGPKTLVATGFELS